VSRTAEERKAIAREIEDYENGKWYEVFIDIVNSARKPDPRTPAILGFLTDNVLVAGQSVLELGAGAGAQMRFVRDALVKEGGHGSLAAVEMVPGWVAAGRKALPEVTWVNADVTEVDLGDSTTYDLVMINDVLEHVPVERHICIIGVIAKHTHGGSAVYVHTPTPETQYLDSERPNKSSQLFENVVTYHELIRLFSRFGFQLERMEHNKKTDCGTKNHGDVDGFVTTGRGAKCCYKKNVPKFAHLLFRRVPLADAHGLLSARNKDGHRGSSLPNRHQTQREVLVSGGSCL